MIIDPNLKVTTDNEYIDIDIGIRQRYVCPICSLSLSTLSLIVNNVLFWNSILSFASMY